MSETDKAALMHQIDTNFVTCFLCCRAAVRAMARGKNGGRIVNVAARPALEWRSGAGMAAYTASKTAVAALTAALAEEVAADQRQLRIASRSLGDRFSRDIRPPHTSKRTKRIPQPSRATSHIEDAHVVKAGLASHGDR